MLLTSAGNWSVRFTEGYKLLQLPISTRAPLGSHLQIRMQRLDRRHSQTAVTCHRLEKGPGTDTPSSRPSRQCFEDLGLCQTVLCNCRLAWTSHRHWESRSCTARWRDISSSQEFSHGLWSHSQTPVTGDAEMAFRMNRTRSSLVDCIVGCTVIRTATSHSIHPLLTMARLIMKD